MLDDFFCVISSKSQRPQPILRIASTATVHRFKTDGLRNIVQDESLQRHIRGLINKLECLMTWSKVMSVDNLCDVLNNWWRIADNVLCLFIGYAVLEMCAWWMNKSGKLSNDCILLIYCLDNHVYIKRVVVHCDVCFRTFNLICNSRTAHFITQENVLTFGLREDVIC